VSKSKKLLEERKRTLARLAASDVAGLMNRSIEMTLPADRRRVYERICRFYGVDPARLVADKGWLKTVTSHADEMVAVLRQAELNINFSAKDFFATVSATPKYATKFEVMRKAGAPMGNTRDQAEEKMFRYSEGVGVDPATAGTGEKAAALRAEDYGVLAGKNFVGAIRPKYCSLNFPALIDGMGAQWGRSHLVLAEHLKPNMTFIHSDSFDVVGSDKVTTTAGQGFVANYHHMYRLLANMTPSMYEALFDVTTKALPPGETFDTFKKKYALGSTAYIEGHVHAEVYFARDLKKIRVCNGEIVSQEIRKNVRKFEDKYSVAIEYFD